uniref:Pseudouridine-5'-phosphate glycosidase n=1 Tax=Steinernema glaseri TaxID=37863 RepID=A0A1I7Y517_9BILA
MLRAVRHGLKISAEVRQALHEKRGVVALESTVITHGLPQPTNIETAKSLENIVRENGAVPATIGLLNGEVHVGLTFSQIEQIADPSASAVKVSQRDIPFAMAKKLHGGTTVAATMFLANLAGIRVFATGGIGGVHRDAEDSFDISADLIELSRTPVAVVCAGVKSILDVGKTLEFMETHGVGVVVHGKSKSFPGFFVPETDFQAPYNSESLEEIAAIIKHGRSLNMSNGMVIACPIPQEHVAADPTLIENAIQKAVKEAKKQKIVAKEVTPYILQRVNDITKGRSMKSNIALLENNARIGAKLSVLLAGRSEPESESSPVRAKAQVPKRKVEKKPKVVS